MSRPLSYMRDAQSVLGFLTLQTSIIEAEVVRIEYPDIQYPNLIPVDTSGPEWAKSVTFFSLDTVGRAEWFNHLAKDVPIADVQRSKYEQGIEMAAIGYRYTLEELGQAMMIPGLNLTAERAEAARRAYEEFVDDRALRGDTAKGWTGLINNADVTVVAVADDGASTVGAVDSPRWRDKTVDQILRDVNDALTGVYTASLTVEIADTILLPLADVAYLATLRIPETSMTVMQWLSLYNVYTMQTNQPLTIRGVRGLETAGVGGVGRMVVYRRDPRVLKLHIPMTHRFLPIWQTGPIVFDVPGIFRFGGVEVRRPGAMRYIDGISGAAYQ